MNRDLVIHYKLKNFLHTLSLFLIMAVITGLAAYMVAGKDGIWLAILFFGVPLLFSGTINTKRLLLARGARPLNRFNSPNLYRITDRIAKRAGLSTVPQLFYEPSGSMNAYATGSKERPVIVFTDMLLRNLNLREFAGIVGHEVAHIKNNDLKVLAIADRVRGITGFISLFAQVVLILALPLLLSGQVQLAPIPVLFIIFAPTMVLMLQMALSRTREFEADLVSCELTGDPAALAQALYKLEQFHRSFWRNIIFMPWSHRAPTWLQTHPPTIQRINRIMELKEKGITGSDTIQPGFAVRPRTASHPFTISKSNCFNC